MAVNIGLRSTGLLVFAGRLISAITGLLFILMVARWLVPAQTGLWEVIVDLVTFASYPVGLVAFWATRDIARGKMVGRTALAIGGLMSGGGLAVYFLFTVVTYSNLAASLVPFLLGALLVPLSYWSAVANSLVQGHRPAVYGYSLVVSELAKLGVAYQTLYVYRMGIDGVILALTASYLVQSVVSTYLVRVTFSNPFDMAQAKRWTRLSWLPAISYLQTSVVAVDTFVAALAFGTAITGTYQVAFYVASVVGYSSALAYSLYPLLLKGGGERLPALTFEFALMFSLPMAAGCIALSGPLLYIMGKAYTPGSEGLAILAAMFVVTTMSGIVDQTLLGTEKVDEGEKVGFWSLARSNLLYVPVVNIAYAIVYVGGMYLGLTYAFSHGFSSSSSVALWASTQFATTLAFLLIKSRRARKYARLLPSRSVLVYLASSFVMGVAVYGISGMVVDTSLGTLASGGRLLLLVALGAAIYFGLVYALDSKFRDLAHRIL